MEIAGFITAIATLMGGVWALLNKQQKQYDDLMGKFLGHLETKNGHNERIVKDFSETIRGFQSAIATLNVTQERTNQLQDIANENYSNVKDVLSECGHALMDYNKQKNENTSEKR